MELTLYLILGKRLRGNVGWTGLKAFVGLANGATWRHRQAQNTYSEVSKKAQRVKGLDTKSDKLSFIPATDMVQRANSYK